MSPYEYRETMTPIVEKLTTLCERAVKWRDAHLILELPLPQEKVGVFDTLFELLAEIVALLGSDDPVPDWKVDSQMQRMAANATMVTQLFPKGRLR